MQSFKILGLLLILSFTFSSCEDDEEQIIVVQSEEKSEIQFSQSESSWFLRQSPDSIIVGISGGLPPYRILERPEFAGSAVVRGSELHIFPSNHNFQQTFDQQTGVDFLVLSDNRDNKVSYNLNVQVDYYEYTNFEINELKITGDSSINAIKNITYSNSYYDRFLNQFRINIYDNGSRQSLSIYIEDLQSKITFPLSSTPYLYFDLPYNAFGSFYRLYAKQNEILNVTEFNSNRVAFNFDVAVENRNGSTNAGNLRVVGDIVATK